MPASSKLNVLVFNLYLFATASLEQLIHQVILEQAKLCEVLFDAVFCDRCHQVLHILILNLGKNLVIIDQSFKLGLKVQLF